MEISSPPVSPSSEGIDRLVKSLIDELIVPRMIEEYLREHGPAATRKEVASEHEIQSDSVINAR